MPGRRNLTQTRTRLRTSTNRWTVGEEQVCRHDFDARDPATARVTNAKLGVEFALTLSSATLPFLHKWKMTGQGTFVPASSGPTAATSSADRSRVRRASGPFSGPAKASTIARNFERGAPAQSGVPEPPGLGEAPGVKRGCAPTTGVLASIP